MMPELFFQEMDKMFKELHIDLEDTDDKEKIKQSSNFITTFSPDVTKIITRKPTISIVGWIVKKNKK